MTPQQTTDAIERSGRWMRLATYASVSVAVTLVAIKLVAWFLTDSASILSTLIDSILDAGASLINLFAVHQALQPADREHRFGHGKAEPLAALAQAAFVAGSSVSLLFYAGQRMIHPVAIEHSTTGIVVVVVAILLTLMLVIFQRFVVARTGSVAIRADSLHYRGDLLINVGVIIALFASTTLGWTRADPLFALGIAAYLFHTAWRIGREATSLLMDRELPAGQRARIREIVLSHPDVYAMHDLRTRSAGLATFIQIHVEMDGDMNLNQAHKIADEVTNQVRDEFPEAEVIVHQDPAGIVEERASFAEDGPEEECADEECPEKEYPVSTRPIP
jgi:ferrous-iron efflux pump FieF